LARENYSYKKFQRELAQKKKREEKLQRKLDKKGQGASAAEPGSGPLEPGGIPSETPAD
jgi:hypothetical protein